MTEKAAYKLIKSIFLVIMKKFCMVLLILACLIAFLFVCGTIDEETETKTKSVSVYDEKTVAVTFDDGPGAESTMMLLDGLKERNVRAAFFSCR